jgi:hypothetical protein
MFWNTFPVPSLYVGFCGWYKKNKIWSLLSRNFKYTWAQCKVDRAGFKPQLCLLTISVVLNSHSAPLYIYFQAC